MDTIMQIERLYQAKTCGERRLFDELRITALEKVKQPETTRVTGHHYPYMFPFQKQPPKIILESSCSALKFRKISWKTAGGFLF